MGRDRSNSRGAYVHTDVGPYAHWICWTHRTGPAEVPCGERSFNRLVGYVWRMHRTVSLMPFRHVSECSSQYDTICELVQLQPLYIVCSSALNEGYCEHCVPEKGCAHNSVARLMHHLAASDKLKYLQYRYLNTLVLLQVCQNMSHPSPFAGLDKGVLTSSKSRVYVRLAVTQVLQVCRCCPRRC